MKKYLLSFMVAVLFLPSLAQAATFESGDEVYIDTKISDDLYASGGVLSVQKGVNGDLIAAGGKVDINEEITQDLMVAGGDISVNGAIGDDVRMAGGSIRIDATIKGDLLAAGGDVSLADSSFVGGDVNMGAGNIMLGGVINGDLRLAGGSVYLNSDVKGDVTLYNFDKIKFGPSARIQGDLSYRYAKELEIPTGMVNGDVVYKNIPESQIEANMPVIFAGFSLFSLLATLFFGLFLIWLGRYYVIHVSTTAYEITLKSLGVGFLVLILTPIAALILLITTIGVPMALVLMAFWFVALYVAKVMAAILIGFKIVKVSGKSSFSRIFGSFALGALIFMLIGMVPIVGWVINLVITLIALGSLTLYESEVFVQLRKKKLI